MRHLLAGAACFVALLALAPAVRAGPAEETEAVELYRRTVATTTTTDRELAQYRIAVTLYHLEFYESAYSVFSEIADDPKHAKFIETLPWLAKLALVLPEPADVAERVGKYDQAKIARFDNDEQRELYWQLEYLLGSYKYRNRLYEEAIALFAKVGRGSKYYAKAQFSIGVTKTQLLRPHDAARVFKGIVDAIDAGEVHGEDRGRMRDLAVLSLARSIYWVASRTDSQGEHGSARTYFEEATKRWSMLSTSSEYWADALVE